MSIKRQPTDENGKIIPSVSGINGLFNTDAMDGTWKAITLPCDAKAVMVQVHNGSGTDFTSFAANPPGFHLAKTATAGTDFAQCVGSVTFDCVADLGTTIVYVRAAAGSACSVMVLA